MKTVASEMSKNELIEGAMKLPVLVRELEIGDPVVVRDRSWEHQRFVGRVSESNPKLGYVVVLLDEGGVRAFDESTYLMYKMTNEAAKGVLGG